MAAGGFAFWVPDIVLHALRVNKFSGIDVLILTIVLPLVTVEVCAAFWGYFGAKDGRAFIALPMILGIWLLGPLFMMFSATFSGGGFATPGGGELVMLGTLLFPAFTFMMSTYDGTLGAVLLATICLTLISVGRLSLFFKRFS